MLVNKNNSNNNKNSKIVRYTLFFQKSLESDLKYIYLKKL